MQPRIGFRPRPTRTARGGNAGTGSSTFSTNREREQTKPLAKEILPSSGSSTSSHLGPHEPANSTTSLQSSEPRARKGHELIANAVDSCRDNEIGWSFVAAIGSKIGPFAADYRDRWRRFQHGRCEIPDDHCKGRSRSVVHRHVPSPTPLESDCILTTMTINQLGGDIR
ncbi:hypothetical protein RISK_004146 [Rhodopirellula islandica]|uniref:Uncharacterized protein n=1 Tax=Rhodopirellula islandica TaxID=595434 RepID=A0A0J1EDY0_RHOIS|nr:hypothetical protein RISK_004146 [Rhodopirellula islandica]